MGAVGLAVVSLVAGQLLRLGLGQGWQDHAIGHVARSSQDLHDPRPAPRGFYSHKTPSSGSCGQNGHLGQKSSGPHSGRRHRRPAALFSGETGPPWRSGGWRR
jgi:hypothetical protein